MGSVADGKCWQWQCFLAHFSFSTLLQAASSDLPQAMWTPCGFFLPPLGLPEILSSTPPNPLSCEIPRTPANFRPEAQAPVAASPFVP